MGGLPTQFPKTLKQLRLYTGTKFPTTPELTTIFDDPPTTPTIVTPPAEPTGTGAENAVTTFDTKLHEEKIKAYFRKLELLNGHQNALFLIIIGQCDLVLKSHLEANDLYLTSRTAGDCVWLLNQIRAVTSKFDVMHYTHDALHTATCWFYNLHQGNRSTADYYTAYKDALLTLTLNHAWSLPPLLQNTDPQLLGATDHDTQQNIRACQLACGFVLNADNRRFAKLKQELREQFARGTNQWPTTLDAPYRLLLTYETQQSQTTTTRGNTSSNQSTKNTNSSPSQ